jgi:chaperonin GroEL
LVSTTACRRPYHPDPGADRDACDKGCGREEGVVAGGGVALLFASKVLAGLNPANNDQKVGIEIVRKAIQWPVRQIAENSGADGSIVVGKLTDKGDSNFGYDAQSGDYKDMAAAGIIDPTEVVRVALQAPACPTRWW